MPTPSWFNHAQNSANADGVSPLVAADGTVYVTLADLNVANAQAVLALTGEGAFKFSIPGAFPGGAALGADGTVYVTASNTLRAVDPASGLQLWSYPLTPQPFAPVLDADGTMLITTTSGTFFRVDAAGNPATGWSFTENGDIHSSPAVATDGTSYFMGEDGDYTRPRLVSVSPAGGVNWMFPSTLQNGAGQYTGGSWTVVASDGTIYCTIGSRLYAVTPAGTQRWFFSLLSDVTRPALGADGTLYLATQGSTQVAGELVAVSPLGGQRWSVSLQDGERILFAPLVDSHGTIFVAGRFYDGSFNGDRTSVYAVSATGQILWSQRLQRAVGGDPALDGQGRILVPVATGIELVGQAP
jgi:outer membrane protein assembly factor BamB